MTQKKSFTFKLTEQQQKLLLDVLVAGNYKPVNVEHSVAAVEGPDCKIALYKSGKCLVQGKGASEWVTFTLEPYVLMEARLGYEEVHDPELSKPHMGVDESGKGDFFGPMVIAAVYVDEAIVEKFREMDVRDSKTITSDKKANDMAKDIRELLRNRFDVVSIGPRAYNRLYASMKNVNKILAWGHARCIENLLQKVPECTRAVSDQFGPKRQIDQALMKHGKKIHLHQMPKAESDPAVAAASVLARSAFITTLADMQRDIGIDVPKGASDRVQAAARKMVEKSGPEVLLDVAKCHFRTADKVLEAMDLDRSALGPDGAAVSKARLA